MIYALISHASTQSILEFSPTRQHTRGKRKARDDGLHQTKLSFVSSKGKGKAGQQTQERRLREMALAKLGRFTVLAFGYQNRVHVSRYMYDLESPLLQSYRTDQHFG